MYPTKSWSAIPPQSHFALFISAFIAPIAAKQGGVVQYVLISVLRRFGLIFPLNWLLITAAIILAAWILHLVCKLIYRLVDRIVEAISDKRESARGSA